MMYNKDHYCPFCWENDKVLRMVYLSPDDKTDLMCDIHGYVYEVDSTKNSYVKIDKPTGDKTSPLIGKAKIDEAKINDLTLFF